MSSLSFTNTTTNTTVRLRHVGSGGQIVFDGGGTLILEDCAFEDASVVPLDIEPNGPLNLVIRNSRISNSASGDSPQTGRGRQHQCDARSRHHNRQQRRRHPRRQQQWPYQRGHNRQRYRRQRLQRSQHQQRRRHAERYGQYHPHDDSEERPGWIQSGGSNAAVLLNASTLDSNGNGATLASNGGRITSYGNNQISALPVPASLARLRCNRQPAMARGRLNAGPALNPCGCCFRCDVRSWPIATFRGSAANGRFWRYSGCADLLGNCTFIASHFRALRSPVRCRAT